MSASSWVGWTVDGWSPGVAWIPRRKRFHWMTGSSGGAVAGGSAAASATGTPGPVAGSAAGAAANPRRARNSVLTHRFTTGLLSLGYLRRIIVLHIVRECKKPARAHAS